MTTFTAQEAFGGSAVGFGPNYPSVEIALRPRPPIKMHSETYVLTSPLASEGEIDHAVEDLIASLKAAGSEAKRKLEAYKARATDRA